MITDEQRQFFAENGYLRYGRVLDMAQVEELRAGLDRVIVFDNGKCSRKITSRSAHSTCSPRANRVDILKPDGL